MTNPQYCDPREYVDRIRSAAESSGQCQPANQIQVQCGRLNQLIERLSESLDRLFGTYSPAARPANTNEPPETNEPAPSMSEHARELVGIGDRLFSACRDIEDFTNRCDL